MSDQRIGMEIKRNNPLYDQIFSKGGNKKFSSIADQAITYLDQFQLKAILYSNGRFWWRIEHEKEPQELFVLRFDMNQAHNQIRNYGGSTHLKYFIPLFHADAFRDGNNCTIPIHMGNSQAVEAHGVIWLKDLNRGLWKAHDLRTSHSEREPMWRLKSTRRLSIELQIAVVPASDLRNSD